MSLKYISLFTTALNIISFLWSVFGVFKNIREINALRQNLLKIFSVLMWFCILFYLFKNENVLPLYLFNIFVQLVALVLFWKTSMIVKRNQFTVVFSNDLPSKLVKEGLYKNIRHPFYMIYITSYFSAALVINNAGTWSLSIIMMALYVVAAKSEEKKFASSSLHEDYLKYKSEAGLFWPKLF